MAIDRYQLISSHNPVLEDVDTASPLTVGNGEFAYTADITGMQTLYEDYVQILPLCTMSQWGWHTAPVTKGRYEYTLNDLDMTEYDFQGRPVTYPQHKKAGNEGVYDWLRQNPHRLNLGRIGLLYRGEEIKREDIRHIRQELHLYNGILESSFSLCGIECHVTTVCSHKEDVLAFSIESALITSGDLTAAIQFPYGSPDISASDWRNEDRHKTHIQKNAGQELLIERTLDRDQYYVRYQSDCEAAIETTDHKIVLEPSGKRPLFTFKIGFAKTADTLEAAESFNSPDIRTVVDSASLGWQEFWQRGGILRLNQSTDPRAWELERRIILSQYLMAVNSCGSAPPQETGLTCNSWYGKMHLEMYLWHCAWLPLWNHTDLLERSLDWYREHLTAAQDNAVRNGYCGARWPKMIAREGIDCPSPIAPLLVWQQPHIIFMLELAYQRNPSEDFLAKNWGLVKETAEFMAGYAIYDPLDCRYHLEPPLIPVQERYQADKTRDPAFEVEYWRTGLQIAGCWAERLGRGMADKWKRISDSMAPLFQHDGFYQSHAWCTTTFTEKANDHPSMLGAMGLLRGERLDEEVMRATLKKVLECWDYASLWGWDFAMMAMTAVRLGQPDTAIDILMKDTLKNRYVASGNNMQVSRNDLPLYLPGNGSLLLAIPLMAAGYPGCKKPFPGFPDDGSWVVEMEGIQAYIQ